MHSPATLGYFCAPPGHYWEWEADPDGVNEAAVWPGDDGGTLLLRRELEDLLAALAPEGLPPLGPILLVVAAASQSWDPARARRILWDAAERATGEVGVPSGIVNLWRNVGRGLDAIHSLPEDLRASGIPRQALLRAIFERGQNRLPVPLSRKILEEFARTPFLKPFQERSPELNGVARMLFDLKALEKAFASINLDRLEQRLRTGVAEDISPVALPEPEPDVTPLPEFPGDLLAQLEQEGGELAQVAGIARRLAAILHVPKPVASRDDLPVGGVSDITNRGDPARLLMTELAWDDTTFAVRLAHGEALYTRRESPPAEPPPQRIILLDTGIYMWGRPRLFGLGAALALARQKGNESTGGNVWTLAEGSFQPAPLTTVEEVRRQLERLEPMPDPGAALAQFVDQSNPTLSARTEVFLVSHPAALDRIVRLPAWQTLALTTPLHSLQVDRAGGFVLSRHSIAGARVLSRAEMDLNKWLGGTAISNPARPFVPGSSLLPQFYNRRPWPLYQPAPPRPPHVWKLTRGCIGVSAVNSVCWWTDLPLRPGRVLCPDAPDGDLLAVVVHPDDENDVILLFRTGDDKAQLLVLRLDGRDEPRLLNLMINARSLVECCVESGALVVHQADLAQAVSLADGRMLGASVRVRTQSRPWFDGDKFHPRSSSKPGAGQAATMPIPKQAQKRHRLGDITALASHPAKGLLIRKAKGRIYALHLLPKGGIEWQVAEGRDACFIELAPMDIPEWPQHGLMHAEFPDKRRVIVDPRGFLHIIGSGKDPEELSVVLVKGATAAWRKHDFWYGEPNLLWGEQPGANIVFARACAHLLKALPPHLEPAPKG